MNKTRVFISTHWFIIVILIILSLATFLRFYNFENRWGLSYDQARDVLVAREALKTHRLPLIGPFASAGQFVYGPQWFWILMLMTAIYPGSVFTPWLIQIFLYILMVLLMVKIGKELGGKIFAIVVGFFTAVSPAQITQATNLTSPSMVSIFAMVTVYFFIKYIKNSKPMQAFLLGFFIAMAVNTHFQAIGLFVLVPISLLLSKRTKQNVMSLLLGLFIPFIPLIIFDLKTNFFESKNMLTYYLHDQYKVSFDVLGRRWLTYASVFWPNAWAHVIGGNGILGYGIIFVVVITTFYNFFKKAILKEWTGIILSLLITGILLRYTRAPLFDSYLVFLHPFILLLSTFAIVSLYKKKKFAGVLFFFLIISGSVQKDVKEIKGATNYTASRASHWKDLLVHTYPGQKFAMYDYKYGGYSFPLILFLEVNNKLSDKGYKIGFGSPKEENYKRFHPEIRENKAGFTLRDLNSSSSAELQKEGWAFVDPSIIYHSTVEWYKK